MRAAPLTTFRVLAVGLTGVAVGILLTLGLQWLTRAGAPVPTAGALPGGTASGIPSLVWRLGLPDHEQTPGAINPAATGDNLEVTVCQPGWPQSVRPPSAYTSALKIAQLFEYGYADRNPRHYQEDHLVPLELGGAPRDPRNLWPQPNVVVLDDGTQVGSKEKDDLEDLLHSEVCAGALSLSEAQRTIAGDWIAAWAAAGRP